MGFGHERSRNQCDRADCKKGGVSDSALLLVRQRKGSKCPAIYAGSADNSEVQCPQRVALMGIVDRQ
jgi:hypothetical protein